MIPVISHLSTELLRIPVRALGMTNVEVRTLKLRIAIVDYDETPDDDDWSVGTWTADERPVASLLVGPGTSAVLEPGKAYDVWLRALASDLATSGPTLKCGTFRTSGKQPEDT